jgi:hypothetical protein
MDVRDLLTSGDRPLEPPEDQAMWQPFADIMGLWPYVCKASLTGGVLREMVASSALCFGERYDLGALFLALDAIELVAGAPEASREKPRQARLRLKSSPELLRPGPRRRGWCGPSRRPGAPAWLGAGCCRAGSYRRPRPPAGPAGLAVAAGWLVGMAAGRPARRDGAVQRVGADTGQHPAHGGIPARVNSSLLISTSSGLSRHALYWDPHQASSSPSHSCRP